MNKQNNNTSGSGYWISSLQQEASGASSDHASDREIDTRVVGVTFEGRQAVVAKLHVGEEILLRREPYNPYDSNAIRVERLDREQIGYINRFLAADLASIFDSHGECVSGTVTQLMGSQSAGYSLGVWIAFTVP